MDILGKNTSIVDLLLLWIPSWCWWCFQGGIIKTMARVWQFLVLPPLAWEYFKNMRVHHYFCTGTDIFRGFHVSIVMFSADSRLCFFFLSPVLYPLFWNLWGVFIILKVICAPSFLIYMLLRELPPFGNLDNSHLYWVVFKIYSLGTSLRIFSPYMFNLQI